jgi:hypothetical protein
MTQAFNLSRFANKVNTSGQADLTTAVTGTLPIANGGTNNGSLAVTAGGVVYTDGTKLVNVGAGTSGQALLSNGASAPTWGSPSSMSWQTVQTANFTAVAGNGYPVNTTSGSITVTFPASPSAGNTISIIDYAGTAATNNIILNPNGNKLESSTNNKIITTNREGLTLVYIDSTQGWLALSDVYSSTPYKPTYTASYLIVAGGGSGGYNPGGGAGAGGLLTGTSSLATGTTYSFTVGAGGAASGLSGGSQGPGNIGSNSTGLSLTAIGGGAGGGGGTTGSGGNGGSGGGAGGAGSVNAPGTGTSGQGNNGGNAAVLSGYWAGGGGGGANAIGNDAITTGGVGGAGTASSITGSSVTYAGGGGGSGDTRGAAGGAGGAGGGGLGGGNGTTAVAGTVNTGGGGGGGGFSNVASAAGGSGIVILSVPTANYSGTTTGSPTVTTSGSNTIIKFTASGSYTA